MYVESWYRKHPSSARVAAQDCRRLILSVDDQLSVLFARYKVLTSAGYAVLSATDGVQALQIFAGNPVDLVLLDFSLQAMDGGLVAEAMKECELHVPIVIVSGAEVPEKCLAIVNGYIRKGDGPELLLQSIQQLLSPTSQPGLDRRTVA